MTAKRAVFIDRDGTLNNHGGYCHPDEFELAPWAIEAIKLFNEHGLPVVIVTNQSGVADGRFSLEQLHDSFQTMITTLSHHNAFIEAIYYCPHSKEDNCLCKKPKPAMIVKAAEFLNVQVENCFMIGDTGYSDMQTGHSAGCKLILVRTVWGKGRLRFLNTVKAGNTSRPTILLRICSRLRSGFVRPYQDNRGNTHILKLSRYDTQPWLFSLSK